MAQEMNIGPRRIPRWIKIALGLSLAANLAVAGLVIGTVARGGPKGPPGPDRSYATAYIKALPHNDRRALFDKARDAGGTTRLSRPERRALFADMLVALRAPELDNAVIRDVLNKQKAASLGIQADVQIQWIALVERMSAPERIAYADAIEEVINRRRGPRKKDRKP